MTKHQSQATKSKRSKGILSQITPKFWENTLHPFVHSLKIEARIIKALYLREIITRYGRNNIGFLWLFFEPLFLTLGILSIWKVARSDTMYGLPVVAFIIIGYPLAVMWRNSASRGLGAISANTGLLYHRNVRALDIYVARSLLEISGSSIAFLFIYLACVILGQLHWPSDILIMLGAWVLMAWFSICLAIIIGMLSEAFTFFGNIWKVFSFILFPLSGIFFIVDTFSPKVQEILLMVPMIHGMEMFRHGYFGDQITTHESISFMVLTNMVMMLIGMALIRRSENKGAPLW